MPALAATALSVLTYPGLPVVDRLRMGAVSAYLKYLVRDWRPLERSTAAGWTRRWMGKTAYRGFVHPLLEGKFGPYADEVNMSWLWARLKARSFLLGYFEGGFQGFADALVERVRQLGATVFLGSPISALQQRPEGGWRVGFTPSGAAEGTTADFDAVVATGSPQLLGRLVPQLPPATSSSSISSGRSGQSS